MRRSILTSLVCLLVVFGACQGQQVMQNHPATPDSVPPHLAQTLSELDAYACPAGLNPALFMQLKGALRDVFLNQARETSQGKAASCLPAIVPETVNEGGADYYAWRYNLTGDYDLNGEVNLSDLTPLGSNFGTQVNESTDPRIAYIDGDGNGEINISDLTVIGYSFGQSSGSYTVYRRAKAGPPAAWVEDGTVELASMADDLSFRYQLPPNYDSFDFKVVARRTWSGTPANEIGYADYVPQRTGAVSGRVSDNDGAPLAGVTVTAKLPYSSTEYSAQTDSAGLYIVEIDDMQQDGDYAINCQLDGYTEAIETVQLYAGHCPLRDFKLQPRTLASTVSAVKGGSAVVKGACSLTVPPNALVDSQGQPLAASLEVDLTYIDPTNPAELTTAPGNFQAIESDYQPSQLESFGMAEIFVDDGTGQPANLAPGSTATLTYPIPEEQRGIWPATIGLYSFNTDTNCWIEEGEAVQSGDGTKYIATVGHFSYWNLDKTVDPTYIKVLVVDTNGTPIPEVAVTSAGVTYNSSTTAFTGLDGTRTIIVEQSAVEAVSATYMGYELGEQLVDAPADYVEQADAPLVATFTIPANMQALTLNAKTSESQAVPYAIFHLRERDGKWLKRLQADASGRTALVLEAGTVVSVSAEYLGAASPAQQLTVGETPAAELVISGAELPPLARFHLGVPDGLAPLSLSLDAATTDAGDGISSYHWIVSRSWNLSNPEYEGTVSVPAWNISITEPGHYYIMLEVLDSNGLSDTQSGSVCVY